MVEFIRKFLNSLKLNARFNLFISALLLIIFSSLGYYLYYTQKQEIFRNSDKQLRVLLEDLINIFEVQTELKQKNINSSMEFTKYLFKERGNIMEGDSTIEMIAIDQETQAKHKVKLKEWYLEGELLQYNYDFVDFIREKGVEAVSILQKFPEGYIRISTNVMNSEQKRAIGTFVPHDSPVAKTVSKGEAYSGRAYVVNDWYITVYEPIFVNSEIAGMLSVVVKQMDYELLKPIFYGKTYFQSGYPYVVSGDGISVINVSGIEGTDLKGTNFFRQLTQTKQADKEKFRYLWPEDETGQWKWTYFKYFEPLDVYIATSIFEYELYSGLDKIRLGIVIGVIIAIIVFFLGISSIIRPITKSIQKLVSIISTMSKGKVVDRIYYRRKDEIGDIIESLNTLIKGLRETAIFANEIEKGNFDYQFKPLSKFDILGNSLLDMRKSLKKAKEEEQRRKEEDEKRKWASEGITLFGDILRQNTDNLERLADNVVTNLVKYLKANQAGLFITTSQKRDETLELVSTYAYNRKKFHQRKFRFGESLVGTCAKEQSTIYISEIPDDYIEIESGLGTSNPKIILLVPLKLEFKVLGVLEIASFNEFDEHEIRFVERLAENIASTLSTVKINAQTAELLKESRKQAKEIARKEQEMRKNLQELRITQQESARRQAEMSGVVSALDASFLVAELDMDGKVIKLNDAFLEIYNLTNEQAIDKHQIDIIALDEKQQEEYYQIWDDLKKGIGGKKMESKHKGQNGEFWLAETYTPILDNNDVPYKVLNIAVDVTQSKLQELEIQELLKDSRRKAKKLAKQEKLNTYNIERLERTQNESARKELEMTSMLEAIDKSVMRAGYSTEGKILSANEKYQQMTGFSLEELVKMNITAFVPDNEKERFDKIWAKVLSGESYEGIEQRKNAQDKKMWLLLTYTPVKNKKNEITKILFIANDITAQKTAEDRMKEQAKKLLEQNKEIHKSVKRMKIVQSELEKHKRFMDALIKALEHTSIVITYNADGTVINANSYAAEWLNLQKEEIIGHTYNDIIKQIHVDRKDNFKDLWHKLQDEISMHRIFTIQKDNKQYCISQTHTCILEADGTQMKVLQVIHVLMHPTHENE